MKYIRLFIKMIEFNLKVQMQYRINFLLQLPIHLSWTLKEVLVIFLMYQYTDHILTWGKYEYIFLLGTYFVVDSILSCVLLPNLQNLSNQLLDGTFDHILLKPIDSQFYTLTYNFNIGVVFALFLGFILVIWSSINLAIPLSIGRIILYLILILDGTLIYASILFICSIPGFKTIKLDYVRNLFVGIANISRKPLDIFPSTVQKILYLLPIAFIAYIPSCYYLKKIGLVNSLASIPVAITLLILTRILWKKGIQQYVSIT